MEAVFEFKELHTVEEMLGFYELIKQLYPAMAKESYAAKLAEMVKYDYKQVVVYHNKQCAGLSGYWINTRLYCDKYIDIDNVIIDEKFRSKGAGSALMKHLEQIAVEQGCAKAVLDAYVENTAAHKFYFREGYIIRGFHFLKSL